ncbi:hypothetical protein BGX28_003647 [Mortierella sp. GBA30]|nr:hypothetical protein BGX28_003647 [Mortierella sp. GBA30]
MPLKAASSQSTGQQPTATNDRPFDLSEIVSAMNSDMNSRGSIIGRADPSLLVANFFQQKTRSVHKDSCSSDESKKKAPKSKPGVEAAFKIPELVDTIKPFMTSTNRANSDDYSSSSTDLYDGISPFITITQEDQQRHSKARIPSPPKPAPPKEAKAPRIFVKPASKIGSVFGLLELVAVIAQYLTPYNMAQCLAVSQDFYHLFTPFFWRHLHVYCRNMNMYSMMAPLRKTTAPTLSAALLAKNCHFLRTLEIDGSVDEYLHAIVNKQQQPQQQQQLRKPTRGKKTASWTTTCVHLRRLILQDSCNTISAGLMGSFIQQNRNLTHLQIPCDFLSLTVTELRPILDAIAKLPNLKHLTVGSGRVLEEETTMIFLRACIEHPSLVEIGCDYTAIGMRDHYCYCETCMSLVKKIGKLVDQLHAAAKAAGVRADRPKIRSFKPPHIPVGYPEDFLVPLLESGVFDLERFDIPRINGGYLKQLENLIRKQFPKLQHLSVSYLQNELWEGQYETCTALKADWDEDAEHTDAALAVIRGCQRQGVRTFQGRVLQSMDVTWELEMIIDALVDYHARTLEEVEVWDIVPSMDQSRLFRNCKNLKRFWIRPPTYHQGDVSEAIEYEDYLDGKWVCRDIKELSFIMARPYGMRDTEDDEGGDEDDEDHWSDCSDDDMHFEQDQEVVEEEKEEEMDEEEMARLDEKKQTEEEIKTIYTKLGSLSELEVLAWESDRIKDVTLADGYLSELAGFKKLRRLEIREEIARWCSIGQPEVEFMHKHWNQLESIAFEVDSKRLMNNIVSKPHWKWLKQQRPQLRFELASYSLPEFE